MLHTYTYTYFISANQSKRIKYAQVKQLKRTLVPWLNKVQCLLHAAKYKIY